MAVSAPTVSACHWLGPALAQGLRIDRDVMHTVVAYLRSERSPQGRNRTALIIDRPQDPHHEQAADGCGYQGGHEFSRRVQRSFHQEGSPGSHVPYPDLSALVQEPQPREHIMSCALRCKAVSPPPLDDPRTHDSRSEGIHRPTPSVSAVVSGRPLYAPRACPPLPRARSVQFLSH